MHLSSFKEESSLSLSSISLLHDWKFPKCCWYDAADSLRVAPFHQNMRARLQEVGINSYVKQLTTYNYKEKKAASPEHLQYSFVLLLSLRNTFL